MLRALHQEGVSLKDMARRLERSQYHVYAELKRMLKIHRSDKDRGLREGLIKEAIDLSRAGMEPKKLRLAHSR